MPEENAEGGGEGAAGGEEAAAGGGNAVDEAGGGAAANAVDEAGGGKTAEGADKSDDNPIPEKFRHEDGTLKQDTLLESYGALEKKLGETGSRPETADDYEAKFNFPDDIDVEIDAEAHKAFLGRAHEAGLTNKQAQFVMDEAVTLIDGMAQDAAHTMETATEELKERFGDKFDENMQLAGKVFNKVATPNMLKGKDALLNNPDVVETLAILGATLKEDSFGEGKPVTSMTEADAQEAMASETYRNKKAPGHAALVAKVTTYFQVSRAK